MTTLLLLLLPLCSAQTHHLSTCPQLSALFESNSCCENESAPLTSPLQTFPQNENTIHAVVQATMNSLSADPDKADKFRKYWKAASDIAHTFPGNPKVNTIMADTAMVEFYTYTKPQNHHLFMNEILAGRWQTAVAAHAGVPSTARTDMGHTPRSITIVAANKTAAEKWYYQDSVGTLEYALYPPISTMSLADALPLIIGHFSMQQGDLRW